MNRNASILLLLGRGIFNLAFGIALIGFMGSLAMHGPKWAGTFALVDGSLGLLWAASIRARAHWLFAIACTDAGVRILVGAFLLGNPGLQASVIGSALFFSLMSVALMAFGFFGGVFVWWSRPRDRALAGSGDLVWSTLISLALTALLGLGLVIGLVDAEKRVAWMIYCILFGVLLCWSARRATRNNERTSL